jgi:ABC-2 type transport system permease protein
MRDSLRLYFRYIGISLRAQMQYRASFVMQSVGNLIITIIEFLGIWALFDRFKNLEGWSMQEVGLIYGIVHVAFAISEAFTRGFDILPGMIRSGEFDRILLRPRQTAFQVIAQELQLMRVGRFLQGIVILIWASQSLNIAWTIPKILVLICSIIGGACVFGALFVLHGTLAFWTVETLEIVNTVTYGGVETAQYPLEIYKSWFRRFFTFAIPLACVNYFPALAILGRSDPTGTPAFIFWISPLFGVVFLWVCLQIWQVGVRHYHSTGS